METSFPYKQKLSSNGNSVFPHKSNFNVNQHCKEIKPVNPKANQSWRVIGRTDAEAPILWPLAMKSQLIRKDPDAGKDWRQEKGTTENEIVGWLYGHESEQAPGVGDGQRSLACCSPRGRKGSGQDWATELHCILPQ